MKKQYLLISNIIIFMIISVIVFILPIYLKNTASFICTYIIYLLFNVIGCIFNLKITEENLKKDLNNLPILNVYILLDIIFTIILFCSRCINISINIIIILLAMIIGIYVLILYSLYNAKKYINNKNDKIVSLTHNAKKWKNKLEILVLNNKNADISNELKDLVEIVKYMDITSNDNTFEVDEKINMIFNKMKDNITIEEIKKLNTLFNERKIILKNNK